MTIKLVWLAQPGYYRLRYLMGLDVTDLELAGEEVLLPERAVRVREGWLHLAEHLEGFELLEVGWVDVADLAVPGAARC